MRELVDIDGVLLLNKPLGSSSNHILQKVKRCFKARKAGHTGSLDPLATGMLPICFGEATKFAQYLLDHDKSYSVKAVFGVQTATGDKEGEIVATAKVPHLDRATLLSVFESFLGESVQIPPMYSALKVNGQKLYDLARKGIEVERKGRAIHLYDLVLEDFQQTDTKTELSFRVTCSKGTYVRTLVEDLAKQCGTLGHVVGLHRNYVGTFKSEPMFSLEQCEHASESGTVSSLLLPLSVMIPPEWPISRLSEQEKLFFRQGKIISLPDLPTSGFIQVRDECEAVLGIGEVVELQKLAPRRVLRYQA